ncbi:MAG: hypothetical protein GXO36_00540, partial [Chloroflexi bacterium]|nr:hypothetical protein [Chloroflexota bacterium]
LHDLAPDPRDEWQRMLRFAAFGQADKDAMAETVEVLFRRGTELVANVYDYLSTVPETAAILGWEEHVDEAHLEERRRFFTIWLARTLGMDTSDEFADYLFRAGQIHAGHGPRRIHVPHAYVRISIGLVLAMFADYMREAGLEGEKIARAMAGWNKYLSVQMNQMELGYSVAREFDDGTFRVPVGIYGLLRLKMDGLSEAHVAVRPRATVEEVLRKFFNYYPVARREALDVVWEGHEKPDSLWMEVVPVYRLKSGWRVLLNGREIQYLRGMATPVRKGDQIDIFPPGR